MKLRTSVRRVVCAAALMGVWTGPALAQVDLTGMWRPMPRNEDGSGMDGDYAGLPLNAAGRARAQSWVPENFDVAEWVCRPHSWDFSVEAVAVLRLWTDVQGPTQQVRAFRGRIAM